MGKVYGARPRAAVSRYFAVIGASVIDTDFDFSYSSVVPRSARCRRCDDPDAPCDRASNIEAGGGPCRYVLICWVW